MTTAVRVEVDGLVLRLYPSKDAAKAFADKLNPNNSEAYQPALHVSELGWVVHCLESGEISDTAGVFWRPDGTGQGQRKPHALKTPPRPPLAKETSDGQT
jgi:hypothetical protein